MTEREFVQDLPDLIDAKEYSDHPEGRLVRLRITVDENGVSVLADAFRPLEVERLMDELGGGPVQQMLCG
ncbi:radical SAM-modified peptide, FtsH ternary system-associated [Actinoplanes sp. NPDC051513]|uniref:radical SAM-modified peptide, FtsH ternary system-associated n=1 Tax=Actinoplanes sp. NPDC051513 TaxID=3363908 RepID=UPI0037A9BFDD